MSMAKMSYCAKFASKAIQLYHSWSPIQRGKYWLLRQSSPFLVAPIGAGLWIRATGVSGFEWKVFRGHPCEIATVALFRRILKPGMTVFDIGANVGYYALVAARAIGPEGQVHAFEATPAVAERLLENVRLNQLKNVTVNHSAVSNQSGEAEFRLHQDDSEGNSLVSFSTDWPAVQVSAITVDDYIADRGIGQVDVLKVDVEGAEPLVFAGATKLLSRSKPPLLIVELNPTTLKAGGSSPDSLRRCHDVEQLTRGSESTWNILAVHSSHDPIALA
jgi:FkbM family methyltransferase